MKVQVFQGKNDPEVYLEWKVELIFYYHNYPEPKKIKLAIIAFTDCAIVWWDLLVTNHKKNYKRQVDTWDKMKSLMRRFVSNHYYRELYQML